VQEKMADPVITSVVGVGDPIIKELAGFASVTKDTLLPNPHVATTPGPADVGIPVKMDYTSSVSWGGSMQLRLPYGASYYASECYLLMTLAAPATGTYASYPGLNVISRMSTRHSGGILDDFAYQPVMSHLLSEMPSERVNAILALAGGATPGACTVVIPLPLFFSSLRQGRGEGSPLPLFALDSNLEINLTLRAETDILAAASTVNASKTCTSCQLVILPIMATDSLRAKHVELVKSGAWRMHGDDFATITAGASATSGADTSISLMPLVGYIQEYSVQSHLGTDLSTAHAFYLQKALDTVQVDVDGITIKKDSAKDQGYKELFYSTKYGLNATLGNPTTVSMEGSDPATSGLCSDGGLYTRKFSSIVLTINESVGTCSIDIAAKRKAVYLMSPSGSLSKIY
jgi:hypothetical protein